MYERVTYTQCDQYNQYNQFNMKAFCVFVVLCFCMAVTIAEQVEEGYARVSKSCVAGCGLTAVACIIQSGCISTSLTEILACIQEKCPGKSACIKGCVVED